MNPYVKALNDADSRVDKPGGSQHNGKKITYATLTGPIFIPGFGQLNQNISSTGDGLHKGVDMTIHEPWVLLEVKDKVSKPVSILVPCSSFTHMVLAK